MLIGICTRSTSSREPNQAPDSRERNGAKANQREDRNLRAENIQAEKAKQPRVYVQNIRSGITAT